MSTTTAPRNSVSTRPLFMRVASKWYSWAGLALTVTGSYLALTGDLKLGAPGQLGASPPSPPQEVTWKAAPTPVSGWDVQATGQPAQSPPEQSEDPFHAPGKPPADAPAPEKLPEVVTAPVPGTTPGNPQVQAVLEAYVNDKPVVGVAGQASGPDPSKQAAPEPIKPDPMLVVPDLAPAEVSQAPGAAPPASGPAAPSPAPTGPAAAPALPAAPQDATPAPSAPATQQLPNPGSTLPVPNLPAPSLELPPIGPATQSPAPAPGPMASGKADEGAGKSPAPKTGPGDSPEKSPARPLESSAMQGEPIPTPPTPLPKTERQEPAAEPESEDSLLWLTLARTRERRGQYREAIDLYERYLEKNPRDVAVRREMAGVMVTARELRRAAEQYERILAESPGDVPTRVRLGDVYVMLQQYRPAINQFIAALEQTPDTRENLRPRLEIATRLARAYAFDSDMVRALQVYERYLARIRPEDANAPTALGALLLDLERAADAVPYLLKQRERHPDDIEVLASLVRAFSRLGERERALQILAEMANKEPRTPRGLMTRILLGETLFDTEDYELAGQVYNQVLQADPTNGSALVGMARVHLRMFQPALARKILDSFVPNAQVQRGYLLTYAAYHETVGEYTEGKQIYIDMLRRDPNDHRVRLSLGILYDYVKEWEKAKAEYAKIPPTGALGRQARLEFANTLANQRKFSEALEIDRVLLTEDPTDATAVSQMVRHLAKTGAYEQAESLARGYLASNPRSEWMALTVRLALAKSLLDAGRNLEAAREYEIALARPSGRIPVSYWGLARASERLGNAERAAQLLACVTANSNGSIRNHVLLADLYYGEYEDQRVVEILAPLAQSDPNNLAVLVRLADSHQRIARMTGQPDPAFQVCQQILTMSPTNVRGHLAMARCFAIAQNFRKATVQYDQLVQIDPHFAVAQRERARVLYSDKQYSAARSQYEAMQTPPPDVALQADLLGLIAKEPKLRPVLEPYTIAQLPGNVLRRELPRIQATLIHDSDSQLAIQRILNDYDARVADQTAYKLESEAKEQKDVRSYVGIFAYNQVNTYEPSNTETLFDAGQNYARLRMTRDALKMYAETLQADPTHREAMVATERAQAEISPKMDMGYSFFYQRGRNGLANIDRHRWWVDGSVPLGDENEYFMVGYARALLVPTDDRSDPGNIPFLRVQKKFDANRLLLYGQLNVEDYSYGQTARPTFDAGYRYDHSDCIHSHAGLFLENVLENGESIRQNIFRGGTYAGLDFTPTRFWAFGGEYRWAHYSDSNDANIVTAYSSLALTLPPKMLRVGLDFFYLNYARQSIFPTNPPDPNNIHGVIHPYFSPKNFVQGFARLEWWHWLSRDYIYHTNQCYYMVSYGIGSDNRLVTYHDVRALVNYDCCSWLTIGAQFMGQFSTQYRMVSALATMQIRFK